MCDCYSNGKCNGTKERDACTCKGDKEKCDFYPEVRQDGYMENHDRYKGAYNAIEWCLMKGIDVPTEVLETLYELVNKNNVILCKDCRWFSEEDGTRHAGCDMFDIMTKGSKDGCTFGAWKE